MAHLPHAISEHEEKPANSMFGRFVAELCGTAVLTFAITAAICQHQTRTVVQIGPELTVSSVDIHQITYAHFGAFWVMALIFGPISGGHFNPAVTFALALRSKIGWLTALLYMVAQFIGGWAGGVLNFFLFWNKYHDSALGGALSAYAGTAQNVLGLDPAVSAPTATSAQLFFVEVIGTMFIVFAFLAACDRKHPICNGSKLVAVSLIAFAYFFVGSCGILAVAGVNPARDFGPRMFASFIWGKAPWVEYTWIPTLAPFAGSVFAASFYGLVSWGYDTE